MWRVKLTIIMIMFLTSIGIIAQEREVMTTDGVQHSVPLEEIIFDDFDSFSDRALRYTDALPADRERLRDRISPLCHNEIAECYPVEYESADTADWMQDSFMVVGYIAEDDSSLCVSIQHPQFS